MTRASSESRYHSFHISIQNGFGLIQSNGENRSCGIVPNTWNFQPFLACFWKALQILPICEDFLSSAVQISRAGIVPQPGPVAENLLLQASARASTQGNRSTNLSKYGTTVITWVC